MKTANPYVVCYRPVQKGAAIVTKFFAERPQYRDWLVDHVADVGVILLTAEEGRRQELAQSSVHG